MSDKLPEKLVIKDLATGIMPNYLANEILRRYNAHDGLVRALEEYGHHKTNCDCLLNFTGQTPLPCNCGLAEAKGDK